MLKAKKKNQEGLIVWLWFKEGKGKKNLRNHCLYGCETHKSDLSGEAESKDIFNVKDLPKAIDEGQK